MTENVNIDRIGGVQQTGDNVVDTTNHALRVNVVAGGGGGGGAVTVADGADIAQGATTDVAVTTDANGTLSAKLRGLVKMLASVWDSANGRLKVDGSGVPQPVTNAGLSNLDVALSTRTKPADQQHTIVDSGSLTATVNVISGFALETGGNLAAAKTDLDTIAGTVSASKVAVADAVLDACVSANQVAVAVQNLPATQAVSAVSLPLPSNAAMETGGNLAAMTALLQNQQKTVDLLERILARLEAHDLMFATTGVGYVATDDIITNIQ